MSQTQVEVPAAEDELDAIAEMRLRTWARRNYVPVNGRDSSWHRVILDEMGRIDEGH